MYTAEAVAELEHEKGQIEQKYQALLLHYTQRQYRTERGREFATQGFSRRLGTLKRCIENVFQSLPPDLEGIPDAHRVTDATIVLQAFLFNVFGCLDNLTWVWVKETDLKRPNGQPLPFSWVGLGSKYQTVRNSFRPEFRDYLITRQEWFNHLEDYRNALAHRIPPYIPPYCVDPANRTRFLELDALIWNAQLADDHNAEEQHRTEQEALKFFRPWMGHSFIEDAPIGRVHEQMLIDFVTIEEFGWRMSNELDELPPIP